MSPAQRRSLPDLRLAGAAVGCWLAALAGLHTTAATGAAVAATATGGLAGLAAGRVCLGRAVPGGEAAGRRPAGQRAAPAPRRARRPRAGPATVVAAVAATARRGATRTAATGGAVGWAVAAVLLGVVAGASSTAAQVAARDAGPVRQLAHRHAAVHADLVVSDDPRPVHSGPTQALVVAARLVRVGDQTSQFTQVRSAVLVIATGSGWEHLLPGQRITATGRLSPARGGDLRAAVLLSTEPPSSVGSPPLLQRAAGGLRSGLRSACAPLPREAGGLLPGLVVGDTSRLTPAVAADFTATGMTHLVAVSGTNCAIVVGAVLLLARWCRLGPVVSASACVVALAGFVILVRPSPSVLRAAAMGGVALLALALGRPRAAVPALAASVLVLLVADPALAGQAGFALSALATAGLLLIAPGWSAAMRRRGVPSGLAEALAVPAAAQLACSPVIAAISATVSVTAVPANLLAAPAVAPATVLGVGAAVLSPVWPGGATAMAWSASWPARWLIWLAHTGAALPGGTLPWPGGVTGGLLLAGGLLTVVCLARSGPLRRSLALVALAALAGALPVRLVTGGWPPTGWFVVACDVGQGDAVVLAAARGQAVVVDAGPTPEPVHRCLRELGVRQVALLMITHFHADHVGGVDGVFRGRQVSAVVTPAYREPEAAWSAVQHAAGQAGTPVGVVVAGHEIAVGAVRLTVLAPRHPLAGTRSDPNNNSLVVRASVAGSQVLLAGDAETEEQGDLLAGGPPRPLRADVLKVAHHGSAYQESSFIAAVSPRVALVSVGTGNDYGLPSRSTLALLARGGALVLRTDSAGDLAVVATAGGLGVATHRPAAGGRRP